MIILVIGLVSVVAFRAWPFFVQQRSGEYGETIRVYKTRSLPTSFPSQLGKHSIKRQQLGRWSTFIRQTHIDELPQILNVLGGTLSLVGPRPMIDDVLDRLEPHERVLRSTVRPGMTGAWQISTMGCTALDRCPELDVAYTQQATWRTDLWILWRTGLIAVGGITLHPNEVMGRLYP